MSKCFNVGILKMVQQQFHCPKAVCPTSKPGKNRYLSTRASRTNTRNLSKESRKKLSRKRSSENSRRNSGRIAVEIHRQQKHADRDLTKILRAKNHLIVTDEIPKKTVPLFLTNKTMLHEIVDVACRVHTNKNDGRYSWTFFLSFFLLLLFLPYPFQSLFTFICIS